MVGVVSYSEDAPVADETGILASSSGKNVFMVHSINDQMTSTVRGHLG